MTTYLLEISFKQVTEDTPLGSDHQKSTVVECITHLEHLRQALPIVGVKGQSSIVWKITESDNKTVIYSGNWQH